MTSHRDSTPPAVCVHSGYTTSIHKRHLQLEVVRASPRHNFKLNSDAFSFFELDLNHGVIDAESVAVHRSQTCEHRRDAGENFGGSGSQRRVSLEQLEDELTEGV